jgi:1-acyl-sn-glycerol-3-phosphate acyltransferase
MLILRSALFNGVYYLNLILWMLAAIPTFVLPRRAFMAMARAWASSSLWLLRVICGTSVDFRGLEKLPPAGFLVAAKHQSMWETFALFMILKDPAFVLKRELMFIPFFGWYAAKARSIAVNRGGGSQALKAMNQRALEEIGTGRQVVIFPEGTRRPIGAPAAYKYGIAHMYEQMGVTCVPIALNSGAYWPRRRFLRYPGVIIVEVLEPIAAGLARETFHTLVQERIEAASVRLLEEARPHSPIAAAA